MKLLILTSLFPPDIGGPATYTYELVRRLQGKSDISIITLTESHVPVKGVKIITLSFPANIPVIRSTIKFIKLVIEFVKNVKNQDIVYVQALDYFGFASILLGKFSRKPVLLRFSGDPVWEIASINRQTKKNYDDYLKNPDTKKHILWLESVFLRWVDLVITPSNYAKGLLVKYHGVRRDSIWVIPNAIDLLEFQGLEKEKIREELGLEGKIITTACRLVPLKRIDELISIIPQVCARVKGAKLLVIGDGPERSRLVSAARQLCIDSQVVFMGRLPRETTLRYMAASDLFVLNSIYETFPHVLQEAMACGVPVMACDVGGVGEIVDENNALLVESGDRQAKVNGIIEIFSNRRMAEDFSKRGRIRAADFAWDVIIEETQKVFRHMRDGK